MTLIEILLLIIALLLAMDVLCRIQGADLDSGSDASLQVENDPDTEDIDACIDYVEGRIATNKMKLKLIVQELDELHEWYVFQCENGAFGRRTIPRKRGKSDTVSKRMQSFAQNTVKRVR
jgi:hypothetical protein